MSVICTSDIRKYYSNQQVVVPVQIPKREKLSKLLPFFKRLNIDWFLPCSRNDHGLRGTLDLCGDNIATKMKR